MVRVVQGAFWWFLTIVTLFVLDDLLFGPFFWMLALIGPLFSTLVAFMFSVMFQIWLVRACLKPEPGKLPAFLLSRLMLERKNAEIAKRESSVKRRATSVVGALLVTPLIGGVIPSLLLHRHGVLSDHKIKRLSLLFALIYGLEFALLHGGYGFGALLRAVV